MADTVSTPADSDRLLPLQRSLSTFAFFDTSWQAVAAVPPRVKRFAKHSDWDATRIQELVTYRLASHGSVEPARVQP